jgi:methyl-accepting chemotaxis protein
MFRKLIPALVTVLAIGSVPVAAQATGGAARQQQPPQAAQQSRMQQRISEQMTEMIQRMDRLRERIHQVDQTLARQMERTADQQRLREHQALREMCGDVGGVAQQMQQNAERLREMSRDRLFLGDPEMEREMERLREHWEEMGERLRESVEALERMQKRLGQPPGDVP